LGSGGVSGRFWNGFWRILRGACGGLRVNGGIGLILFGGLFAFDFVYIISIICIIYFELFACFDLFV
jgi:hypothetical protein